jgi:Na+-driven multidrug efflux pump
MAFPLFFIAKSVSVEKAGYVAVGFTLVQLVASLFEFIGTILLPKTAILISENRYLELKRLVKKILFISVSGSIIISAFLFINLNWLLGLLDKRKFTSDANEMKVIIYSIPFYIIYLILRNPLDAIDRKPYNMYNLVFCFIVQSLLLFFGVNFFTFKIIYTLSVIVPLMLLGVFTFFRWNLTLKKHFGDISIISCC